MSTAAAPHRGGTSGVLTKIDSVIVWIALAMRVLAGVVIVMMMVTTVYDVIMRFAFAAPTDWALTLNAAAILAATFWAVPHLTATNSHIDMDLFTRTLNPSVQRVVSIVVSLISLVFGALLAWLGYRATLGAYLSGLYTSGNFALPMWLLYAMIWIGGLGMVLVIIFAPWRKDAMELEGVEETDLSAGAV